MIVQAVLFVVFLGEAALFGLVGLEELLDCSTVALSLHPFLRGVVLLEGLLCLLLHRLHTINKLFTKT